LHLISGVSACALAAEGLADRSGVSAIVELVTDASFIRRFPTLPLTAVLTSGCADWSAAVAYHHVVLKQTKEKKTKATLLLFYYVFSGADNNQPILSATATRMILVLVT